MQLDVSKLIALKDVPSPLYNKVKGKLQTPFLRLNKNDGVDIFFSADTGEHAPKVNILPDAVLWPISPYLSGAAVADLVGNKRFIQLLLCVSAGHSVASDGTTRIGKLDDDAGTAYSDLSSFLKNLVPDIDVLPAGEWIFRDGRTLADVWPGGESILDVLDSLGHELQTSAGTHGRIVLDGSMEDTLLDEVQEKFEKNSPFLSAFQLSALVDAGRITRSQAVEYFETTD
ncbi:MAG: hypothetical protein LBQ51_00065 [Desulfovibrio sp.]|jgi:hypothetical protein|nr:hypothetical protein [Desulfovibrio sp.]